MDPSRSALSDWAYPAEDDVPETLLHLRLRTMLYTLVQHYLVQRGVQALTGSEQFLYWVQGNPGRALAPDLYVVLGEDPNREVRVWQTWVEERAPDLAVEIVSDDIGKDYQLGPLRYAEAGVRELIVFDPLDGPSRTRWQVYRRDASGDLVRVLHGNSDRAHSAVLDCHLRWLPDGDEGSQLRLGDGPNGDHLVPTALEDQRAATERERAAKERERAAKEQERAAKEREQERNRELEQELATLRAQLSDTKKTD